MLGGIRGTDKIIQVAIYCQQIRATMENFSTIVLVIRQLLKGRGKTAVFLIDHTGSDAGDIKTPYQRRPLRYGHLREVTSKGENWFGHKNSVFIWQALQTISACLSPLLQGADNRA